MQPADVHIRIHHLPLSNPQNTCAHIKHIKIPWFAYVLTNRCTAAEIESMIVGKTHSILCTSKGSRVQRLRCKLDLGSFAATLAASPFKASTLLLRTWATGRHWARVVQAQTKGWLQRFTLTDSDLPKDLHQVLAGPAHDIPASPKTQLAQWLHVLLVSTCTQHTTCMSGTNMLLNKLLCWDLFDIAALASKLNKNRCMTIMTTICQYAYRNPVCTIHQVVDWRSFQNEF